MVQAESISGFGQSFKHLNFVPLTTYNRATTCDTNENDGVAFSGKMVAVAWKSTSAVAVFNSDQTCNFDARTPLIQGHNGTIFDMQWSPFEDRLLATCADDGKAKFWVFDDYQGLMGKSNRQECDLELDAHSRKCISVQWHAAAENLLATHSIDQTQTQKESKASDF